MSEEQTKHTEKIAKKMGDAEARLWAARHDLVALEPLLLQARSLAMADGDTVLSFVTRLADIAGSIAAAEQALYKIHAEMTEIAKVGGFDVVGPYRVLVNYMPPVEPKSGGGRR